MATDGWIRFLEGKVLIMKAKNLPPVSRRQLLAGGIAAIAVSLGSSKACASSLRAMTIYRDPGCGCCLAWAAHARRVGFTTRIVDTPDMASVKRRLGVPPSLASCHTAVVNGLVVEGHVPLDRVTRFVNRRPANVRGVAVPGMPAGSPGMEVPGGGRPSFQVFTFDAAGRSAVLR